MRDARHPYHATADAVPGQPRLSSRALIVAALLVYGCGDPVGDARGGFQEDPAPVLGRWVEREPTGSPPREAFIEAGRGVLAGRFEFEQTGLPFTIEFTEGAWEGSRITFATGDVFGASGDTITWTALLVPADEGAPTVLRLFPMVGGGVPFSVEYVRP